MEIICAGHLVVISYSLWFWKIFMIHTVNGIALVKQITSTCMGGHTMISTMPREKAEQ